MSWFCELGINFGLQELTVNFDSWEIIDLESLHAQSINAGSPLNMCCIYR